MSSYPPMAGWATPCDACATANKRCYCYRTNVLSLTDGERTTIRNSDVNSTYNPETTPSPFTQLPEGD